MLSSSPRFRPSHSLSPPALAALLLAVSLLLMAGCTRAPEPLPGAEAAPATAVQQIATRLRANDLVGYAKALVTPAQYGQLETAWREGRSRWPLSGLPLSDELPTLLATLSRPDAERTLRQAFDAQIAGQAADIRQAAKALGLFGVRYLHGQTRYSQDQRAHYVQLVNALSQWAAAAPLTDRARADQAIAALTAAARRTGLGGDAELRQAGMEESLRRLGPFLATFKAVLADYGLALDPALDALRTGLVEQQGDRAIARIDYPLAGAEIDTVVALVRREGRWYLQRTQDDVAQLLGPALPAVPDSVPTAGR